MRHLPKILLFLVLFSPLALQAGGKRMPAAETVRNDIAEDIPGARFERESRIRLGRIALTFIKPIVRLALDEEDEARAIIKSLKRVDIATYRVVHAPGSVEPTAMRTFERRMTTNGWNKLVRSREEQNNTWVFSRHKDNGRITGILVVELDGDELSIVGVEGRLDELLAHAIADDPGEFSDLFGS